MAQRHGYLQSYSFNNQMLIAFQRPSASRVAGFQAWRKLGRHVNQRRERHCHPRPLRLPQKNRTRQRRQPHCQTPLGIQNRMGFRPGRTPANLCPRSPMPRPMAATNCSPASNGPPKKNSASASTTKKFSNTASKAIPPEAASSFAPASRPAPKPQSYCMNSSHEKLHQGDKRDEAKAKSRRQRELEAEATAYVVMRHFGIDHVASNYLATYNIDGEQLKQSLETISATAKFLIAAIDPQHNQTPGGRRGRGLGAAGVSRLPGYKEHERFPSTRPPPPLRGDRTSLKRHFRKSLCLHHNKHLPHQRASILRCRFLYRLTIITQHHQALLDFVFCHWNTTRR